MSQGLERGSGRCLGRQEGANLAGAWSRTLQPRSQGGHELCRTTELQPDRCVGSGGKRGNVMGAGVREVSRGWITWASLATEGSWNLFSVS